MSSAQCQCLDPLFCICPNSQWFRDATSLSLQDLESLDFSSFDAAFDPSQAGQSIELPRIPAAPIYEPPLAPAFEIINWTPSAPSSSSTASAAPVNQPSADAPSGSRKRKERNPTAADTRSKRSRTATTAPIPILPAIPIVTVQHHQAAQTCGAGPQTSLSSTGTAAPNIPVTLTDPPDPPSDATLISTSPEKTSASTTDATDVYYFLRALDMKVKPTQFPDSATEPVLHSKPKSDWVGCKACPNTKWKTWHNNAGLTTTVRKHLRNHHKQLYETTVALLGLKAHDPRPKAPTVGEVEKEPFSLDGFNRVLVRLFAVGDQSLYVIDSREFREVILYDAEHLRDEDIPHRTKLRELIRTAHKKHRIEVQVEMAGALGRISFTADLWTDPILRAFMAVTAHYIVRIDKSLVLKTRLLAFKHIVGHHDGASLAWAFFAVLEEEKIMRKVGSITMDSATSNDTKMSGLQRLFTAHGITFDHNGNRIRCFPHSVNRSVKAVLEEIKKDPIDPVISASNSENDRQGLSAYAEALSSDPVRRVRELVAACRKSGERRADLRRIIVQGNVASLWGQGKQVPELQLLRDCDTRWSSTYQMIGRALTLYPAIKMFLNSDDHRELAHLQLTSTQQKVLIDIHQVLQAPHAAQEVLSSSRTPTLSMALPCYELLLTGWQHTKAIIPEMASYIDAGMQRLEKYIRLARKTRIYALAMILNPTMKFEWMKNNWAVEDGNQAREWMEEVMAQYACETRLASSRRSQTPSAMRASSPAVQSAGFAAAAAQKRGKALLKAISKAPRRSASTSSIPSALTSQATPPTTPIARAATSTPAAGPSLSAGTSPTPNTPPPAPTPTAVDQASASLELSKYEGEGLYGAPSEDDLELEAAGTLADADDDVELDLVEYWQDRERQYPLLFRVAMDILPAQASAVPCEEVFSSSKETITERRTNMSPELLSELQILKYAYKQDRLSFTSRLVAEERDYTLEGHITDNAVQELLAAGRFCELEDLLSNVTSPH
ncbi:hypothetical protein TRAPUB_3770 [Trametes pubescens]|uniref:HAT C-terminal dimerisation domain-containing protein n=1 Tax=Trametes pubescens TaxID=154538 RepID=A0A1M2VCK1_TRAPU|nr:hypothetical protein TRAPUB_3770 [Trametes pubescens]